MFWLDDRGRHNTSQRLHGTHALIREGPYVTVYSIHMNLVTILQLVVVEGTISAEPVEALDSFDKCVSHTRTF